MQACCRYLPSQVDLTVFLFTLKPVYNQLEIPGSPIQWIRDSNPENDCTIKRLHALWDNPTFRSNTEQLYSLATIPHDNGQRALLHAQTSAHEQLHILMPNATQRCHFVQKTYQVFNFSYFSGADLYTPMPVATA